MTSAVAIDVCCEKLASAEDYCVYTAEEQCDPKYKDASINCEQTSFCKTGCCYSSDEGECYANVARAECGSVPGSTWSESPSCEIPQCQKGCCVIGSQGFFVTEVKCKLETSNYGNVTMKWMPEILTELECQSLAKSQEQGCCVSSESCKFTTRENCPSASLAPTSGNQTGDGFYKDMLCSNDLLSCGCAKQTNTGCDGDKVYWLDSCGNRENVYSSDKVKSYNNGYVAEPDTICNSPATGDPNCGNCDYSLGSICRKAKNTKPKFGDLICSTTKCSTTYNDGLSSNAGTPKKNGESWCLYDSAVGKAQDPVGSRHYRHLCINGEEMNEPCMDYREEICVQGVLGEEPADTLKSFQTSGDYIEAACRKNRWEDCSKCNEQPTGDKIKTCCENENLRDCYLLSATGIISADAAKQTGITGLCVPQVPPGLQFWPSGTTEPPSSSTRSTPATTAAVTGAAVTTGKQTGAHGSTGPNSNAESVCSQANMECVVKWHIGGTGKIGIGGIGTQKDWECVQNCHCTEPEWVIGGNTLCKVQGDCGAKFNYMGKVTLDGYANTASEERKKEKGLYFDGHKLTEKDVGNWDTIAKKGEALKEDTGGFLGLNMGDLVSRFGLPVLTFAASGLYTSAMGGTFMSGATGGLTILGKVPKLFTSGGTKAFSQGVSSVYGEPIKNTALTKDGVKYAYDGSNWMTTKSVTTSPEMSSQLTTQWNSQMGFDPTTGVNSNLFKGAETSLNGQNFVYDGTSWTSSQTTQATEKVSEELTKQAGEAGKMEGGGTMGTINTIMWLYTIYQLIDLFFADDKEKTYEMTCGPWVAPEKSTDCEKCNQDKEKPCSLYRCKSLGQNCYLVNVGTSEEKCVNMNQNDVNAPIISTWPEVIPKGYTITETTDEGNKGYKVNEKVGPYDSITLGIKTNEVAQCKISDKIGTDFDQMVSFFGDSQYVYEHQITFTIPAEFMTKEALKKTGDTYSLYIRCKDSMGNKNEKDYFIRFTLKPEPDMTAPVVEKMSIEPGSYISSGTPYTGFSIYVNEKAECRYDTADKEFDLMGGKFDCQMSPLSVNTVMHGLYECKTTLDMTNITKYEWYMRCKDAAGNKNKESSKFSLLPTDPLQIISIGPTGTFFEKEVTLKVATAEGAENGKAVCGYSNTDDLYTNMVAFFKTGEAYHEQVLAPGVGDFTYYVKCMDKAGNLASANTTFTVDVDLEGPKIVFIYVTPSNYLHMEMDEPSTCEYSNSTFLFGTGNSMTGAGTNVHELSIAEKMYSIVCEDTYKNEAKFTVYP
ncbi:hypothetical protein FJZ53_01500 [Candidatus Woesearchaeota archaeon]|nr:hypothetical protein [Candidatus Woesearchaeota archaeon]